MMGAHDDAPGVLENMGLRPSPVQLYLTNSFAIGVVTAVLGGSTIALAVGAITGAPLGVDIACGAVIALGIVPALMAYVRRHYGMAPTLDEPMFPTP
jgi:hypothetical protein